MKAKDRKKLILASLPLMDTGGPVMVSIPPEDYAEERRRSKAQTKAPELRRRGRGHSWHGPSFDGRQDLIHLVKLGLVKRERSGRVGRAHRTYFVLAQKPVDKLDLWRSTAEMFAEFLDGLPNGWLGKTAGDVGVLNQAYINLRAAREADAKVET